MFELKFGRKIQMLPYWALSVDFPLYARVISQGEEEVEDTAAEMLYLGMLPNLSQYVVSD